MSNLYRKIYTGRSVIEYHEYIIDKLKEENKALKKENEELKKFLDDDIKYKRIQKAIHKLSAATNHYKTEKENNAIDMTLKILKGESFEEKMLKGSEKNE